MSDEWQVSERLGWIDVPGFGRANPRRGNVSGGRQYFTAVTHSGEYAKVKGECISRGPETWHFEGN